MAIDQEILQSFLLDSKYLVVQMTEMLEECDGDFDQVLRLEDYGQAADRIMGAAQSLAMLEEDTEHVMHKIGSCSAICKVVGYKTAQITDNEEFYNICVGLLLDATEILGQLMAVLESGRARPIKELVSDTVIERMRWVSAKFPKEYRSSLAIRNKPAATGEAGAKTPATSKDVDAALGDAAHVNSNADVEALLKKLIAAG